MKRCTALRRSRSGGLCSSQQRWTSYDKASLTREALVEKVESGLADDGLGNRMKLNPKTKTISTASGPLPISPLFDPAWIKARRRQKKDAPGVVVGRFRRKLANNPYARALAEPLRHCQNTKVILPRFFLQDFEVVKHPTSGQDWFAPGPLAFQYLRPRDDTDEAALAKVEEPDNAEASAAKRTDEMTKVGVDSNQLGRQVCSSGAPSPGSEAHEGEREEAPSLPKNQWRIKRSPVTGYAACQKRMIDSLDERRYCNRILSMRTGMAMTMSTRMIVWPKGTGDTLLRLFRQYIVNQLIEFGTLAQAPFDKFVTPVASWDAIKDVKLRGCVLWLPQKRSAPAEREQGQAPNQHATLDVDGVAYGRKMAVHDLWWLLGDREVERLRLAAPVFRNEAVVLRQWRSLKMMQLHMLLWRLQGYLSDTGSDSNTSAS